MLQELSIDTTYGKVYGRSAGNPASPLILAIHGWSQRNGWHTWKSMLQPLGEASYFVVSVDMPGWGKSRLKSSSTLSTNEAVATAVELIKELDYESTVIMGKSWGGGVAFQLALDHPDLVSNLIVTAPAFREISALKRLIPPVLMAWAEDDPVIPIRYAAEYKAVIPKLEFVSYESGGHSAGPKNAGDFAPRAISFLGNSSSHQHGH